MCARARYEAERAGPATDGERLRMAGKKKAPKKTKKTKTSAPQRKGPAKEEGNLSDAELGQVAGGTLPRTPGISVN